MQPQNDFYTSTGIHVYYKDQLQNNDINVEEIISLLEQKIPHHLLEEVEMVIVGWFDEFEERELSAFYDSGTLYISNSQIDGEEMLNNTIHETAHSLEQPHGYLIYGDGELKNEFLRKREHLHDIMWANGYKIPKSVFLDPEYNEELDMFLYEDVGYGKLTGMTQGLFLNAYAVTSLREYFATGFTEYFTDSNHTFLKKLSPVLYSKISGLHTLEEN
tara:strand:+ start:7263 stop:7913 length:651 start_codon:yes stop_codon:yes gene_type:complete